ncbi:hypothetical protein MKEN_00731300 [Mycena kentingensis (nom. inval.)]|nr:hypothetical protein MKEN_00731300 [Mycena kentingensis (nom. inval.)]
MVFLFTLFFFFSSARARTKTDLPIYVYLFVTHCASWIFVVARVWGNAAQLQHALKMADKDAAVLPGYIDCSSLFLILAAADLFLGEVSPLTFGAGLYIVDIVRALDLGQRYTESSLISSVLFDVVGTSLVAGKLLFHRSRVEILGPDRGRIYGRIATIFIESSVLASACRLVWMAAFASNVQNAISWTEDIAVYGSLFGPILIILRMLNLRKLDRQGHSTLNSTAMFSSGTYNDKNRSGDIVFIPPKAVHVHQVSTHHTDSFASYGRETV